eukprot:m.464000 g.464000  ORF g.464000 m.464000 type:complete len:514 (+) comp23269_c0_seq1:71-1612(+)
MADLSELMKGASDTSTNYWDILVFSAATTAFGVSAVGGVTALATDIECDTARFDTVKVCCSVKAPPPVIPIAALVCGVIIFGLVYLRRLHIRMFQAFRSDVRSAAAAYSKTTEEEKTKALKNRVVNLLPHTTGKVKRNLCVLQTWACVQLFFAAVLFICAFAVLSTTLGDATMYGGEYGSDKNLQGRNYYHFDCPNSCSVLTLPPTPGPTTAPTTSPTAPTAAPTRTGNFTTLQPTVAPTTSSPSTLPPIRCRMTPESPGLFWTLVAALGLNLGGTLAFLSTACGLATPKGTEHKRTNRDDARWETHVLLEYVNGDKRDLAVEVFVGDMKGFVDDYFRTEFKSARNKLIDIRDDVAQKLKMLAQVYCLSTRALAHPDLGQPLRSVTMGGKVEFDRTFLRLDRLHTVGVFVARHFEKFKNKNEAAISASDDTEERLHDGARLKILRQFQHDIAALEKDRDEFNEDFWTKNGSFGDYIVRFDTRFLIAAKIDEQGFQSIGTDSLPPLPQNQSTIV